MVPTLAYTVFRAIIDGLLEGSLYALMGFGLTIVFRVTRVANFAHAEYVTYGAYAAYVAMVAWGLGLVPAAIVAALVVAGVALASDELVFKPLWRRGSTPLHFLVASIGVGLVLRFSLQAVAASVPGYLNIRLPEFPSTLAIIGGKVAINVVHALAPLLALGTTAALHVLFTRTKLGKAMRATASNPTLARISGINVIMVRRVTWIIGGLLAGLSGFIISYYIQANPEVGWNFLLWMFAAAIAGGFTFYGTIIAGIILGVVGQVAIILAGYYLGVTTAYKPAIALVIMVLVLLFRPEGIIRIQSLGLRRRA